MTRGKGILLMAGLIAACTASSQGEAQVVNIPKIARNYSATLVRAMDECIPSGLSVVGMGLPGTGCLAANAVTDDQMTFDSGKVTINARTGRVRVLGRGLIPGKRVHLVLQLRITKSGMTTLHPPNSSARVTFADRTVVCGQAPFGFVINGRGVLGGKIDLAQCLAPNIRLETGNIEILDAYLVNADNGDRVFARPGILR